MKLMFIAYIDPGTGSMLVMALGTVLAGAVLFFSFLKWKILGIFGIKKPDDLPEDTQEDAKNKDEKK